MKKILLIGIALSTLLAGCHNKDEKVEIIGDVTGFKDSTMIILDDCENEISIDTAYVINNRFKFEVTVTEPRELSVRTDIAKREEFEYKYFWIENENVKITATKGALKKAIVEGSNTQKENDALYKNKVLIEAELDSLHAEFRKTDENDTLRISSLRAIQSKLYAASTAVDTSFVRANPNSLISAHTLTFAMRNIPKESVASLYDHLSPQIKSSKYGNRINMFLKRRKEFKIGDLATNFQLTDLKGNTINLSSFRKKYVLMEFWGSSCGPCRMENPNLLKNYKTYREKGFEIFSICLDKNKLSWKSTVQSDSMIWVSGSDLQGMDGEAANIYNIRYVPKNYLLDPKGVIIAEDLRDDELGLKLKEIFK